MNAPIVTVRSWGQLCPKTWTYIHECIAKGKSFRIWCGNFHEIPWPTGKCSLKVKVGKKRKLVRGHLNQHSEGREDYVLVFTPTRARILKQSV